MDDILYVNMCVLYEMIETILSEVEDQPFYYNCEILSESNLVHFYIRNKSEELSYFDCYLNYDLSSGYNLSEIEKEQLVSNMVCDYSHIWNQLAKETLNYPYIGRLFRFLYQLEENEVYRIEDEIVDPIIDRIVDYGVSLQSLETYVDIDGIQHSEDKKYSFN